MSCCSAPPRKKSLNSSQVSSKLLGSVFPPVQMDKAKMVEEKKSFKKMSVVPNKNDFVDAILSLKGHQGPAIVIKSSNFSFVRHCYVDKVMCAKISFLHKLSTVLNEFPHQIGPLCNEFPHQQFNSSHLVLAIGQLKYAMKLIIKIGKVYKQLLNNEDDCISLDQCKYLKVNALGCMYTVAMRCLPSLAYLEKLRQYVAQETEKNLEDDNAATLTTKKLLAILAEEDCNVPHTNGFDVQNVDSFVPPETLRWLKELEHKHGFRLQDDQLDCAKLPHKYEEHVALSLAV